MRSKSFLDGVEFKQIAYARDRDSREALARFLKRASGGDQEVAEEERGVAASPEPQCALMERPLVALSDTGVMPAVTA